MKNRLAGKTRLGVRARARARARTGLEASAYVSMVWRMPEAKNLKLRTTRLMSTALASQTGFPWSRDSARANSSLLASTMSAIFSITLERSLGEVLDHLTQGSVYY